MYTNIQRNRDLTEFVSEKQFNDIVRTFVIRRNDKGKPLWTRERIARAIAVIEQFKWGTELKQPRTNREYYYGKKYEVMTVDGRKRLILKRNYDSDPFVEVVATEDFYQILWRIHESTGHGGRDKMLNSLKSTYFIPSSVVLAFLKLCSLCQARRRVPKPSSTLVKKRGSIMTSNDFTRPTPKMAHTHPPDYKACELAKSRYLIPDVDAVVLKKENGHGDVKHNAVPAVGTCSNRNKEKQFHLDRDKVEICYKMNITLDPKQFRIEKTTRGAPCLIFENYKFRYGNKMKDEIRWRCTNKLCKATIKTNSSGITEKRTFHDHEPFCDRKTAKKHPPPLLDKIKLKPATSYYGPRFSKAKEPSQTFSPPKKENVSAASRSASMVGGVRYMPGEYQPNDVMLGNDPAKHFMELLLSCPTLVKQVHDTLICLVYTKG